MSADNNNSFKLSLKLDNEVKEAFRLFDKDGDGKVTRREIQDLIKSLGGDPECPHVQEMLKASERNCLDVETFMRLWKDFKANVNDVEDDGTEDEIKEAFQDYDINGDGYITKDEMVQAMTKMGFVNNKEEEAVKCLREMDLDGDGRVSYAEFMVKWRVT